ncbi:ROK family protein [Virgisporangium aurantiacum]|uniref:ROK family protein n=1 Tax=Virgisporangium aurantiacum TaxID=175570 RepID=UPI00194EA468|nr:ROK family protein [Virgisporangium aurantiacum]
MLGVDVGGTSVRAVARLADGSRTPVVSRPVPRSYPELLDVLAGLAPPGPVRSVVVGLPGATGTTVPRWIPALSWLDGRPLAADLAARLAGTPDVVLRNDAQVALLGEAREGAALGRTDAVLVSVGTGVGGAIMLGGRIVGGATGTAGAFGWLPSAGVTATTDHGALELAASGRALDRLAGPGRAGSDLVADARADDGTDARAARRALDDWAAALGRGIAAVASVLDPEIVVLAGGLCEAFDAYAEPLRAAVRAGASPATRNVAVVPARLGGRAGAIGALCATDPREVWT